MLIQLLRAESIGVIAHKKLAHRKDASFFAFCAAARSAMTRPKSSISCSTAVKMFQRLCSMIVTGI